jgi:hypothetical protein
MGERAYARNATARAQQMPDGKWKDRDATTAAGWRLMSPPLVSMPGTVSAATRRINPSTVKNKIKNTQPGHQGSTTAIVILQSFTNVAR